MLYLFLAAFLVSTQATAQPAPSKPQYSKISPQLATVVSSRQFVSPLPSKPSENTEIAQIKANQQAVENACSSKGGTVSGLSCVLPPPPTPVEYVSSQSVTYSSQTGTNLPSGGYDTWMAEAGISPSDYGYVNYIVTHESGWDPTEWNTAGSGAYGLGQALPASKMAVYGADYMTNPITQLVWANSYALSRYGSWYAAYIHWTVWHSW